MNPSDNFTAQEVLRVNTSSGQVSRAELGGGGSYGGKRDRFDALGYPELGALEAEHHWNKYERSGIARTIVDKPARDTWREAPEITDGRERDEEDPDPTEFEQAVDKLFDGDELRRSLLHRLYNADRLARLTQYSVLYFGFPGDDLTEEVNEGAFDGFDDLDYLATFDETRAGFSTVTDLRDERYGLPEAYALQVESADDVDESAAGVSPEAIDSETTTTHQTVHHSRTVHIVEDALDNDLYGTRVMKPIWNRLEDVGKVLGGSAEMFWRGAYPGVVVEQDPEYRMADNGEGLAEQIQEYRHQMRRTMFPVGASVETLDTTVASPADHLDDQLSAISAYARIPKNMIRGNETGERATTQDRLTWHAHIQARRNNWAEPMVLRPVIDTLIDVGIIPEPEGGDDGENAYEVDWPPLVEPTEQEEAEIQKASASAIKSLSGGKPDRIASIGELRSEVLGWGKEKGSEVPGEPVEPMDPIDEDDDRVQDQFDRQQDDGDDDGDDEQDDSAGDDDEMTDDDDGDDEQDDDEGASDDG